jgi:hypothetical protein
MGIFEWVILLLIVAYFNSRFMPVKGIKWAFPKQKSMANG